VVVATVVVVVVVGTAVVVVVVATPPPAVVVVTAAVVVVAAAVVVVAAAVVVVVGTTTIPTGVLPTTTVPSPLSVTVTGIGSEVAVPRVSVKLVVVGTPLASIPAVATFNEQGSTVNTIPTGSKAIFETATVKWHEPKLTAPVAVVPPFVIINVVAVGNCTVVGPASVTTAPAALVPENPLANVNTIGAAPAAGTSAPTVVEVTAEVRPEATTAPTVLLLSPLPHATNAADNAKQIAHLANSMLLDATLVTLDISTPCR
jgi:hypothetical protein